MLLEKIEELLKEVDSLTAKNAEEVEQLRIKYLSKKGEINALMADFRNVPGDQKKEVGIKINGYSSCVPSYGLCKKPNINIQNVHPYFLSYRLKPNRKKNGLQ